MSGFPLVLAPTSPSSPEIVIKVNEPFVKMLSKNEIVTAYYNMLSGVLASGYIPPIFWESFYYKVFGRQMIKPSLYLYFENGKPVFKKRFDSKRCEQKVAIEDFQKLYDRSAAVIRANEAYLLIIEEAFIFVRLNEKYFLVDYVCTNLEPEELGWFLEGITLYKEVIDKTKFNIALYDPTTGINLLEQESKGMEIDIEQNYNDDVPYDTMKSILSEAGKSLLLFYGEPGTGKSTIIRKLMSEVDRKFILMDPSIITTISDCAFIAFLAENRGSVIVLEDCEKLLKSREEATNLTIGTILNLTDGIIGDAFEVKFICTFNSDVKDIDMALLRKGRLSLKYEFKKLSLEKARKIYPDAKEDMSIADAYFATKDNDFSKEEKKRIGF